MLSELGVPTSWALAYPYGAVDEWALVPQIETGFAAAVTVRDGCSKALPHVTIFRAYCALETSRFRTHCSLVNDVGVATAELRALFRVRKPGIDA